MPRFKGKKMNKFFHEVEIDHFHLPNHNYLRNDCNKSLFAETVMIYVNFL